MQKIKEKADNQKLRAKSSPKGHWAKNFAAMSMHRRENWAVTMKGFNKYVLDYESSDNDNVYGIYQSHGALQIANSEDQLKYNDIENGWDWTKVPGTTTIGLNFSNLKIGRDSDRSYSKKALAGGVTFSGRNPYDVNTLNGVFRMDFSQPTYNLHNYSPLRNIDFKFRKSVFFHDDFLVCVGSRITTSGVTGNKKTYTTLFQNKVPSYVTPASNPEVYKCGNGIAKTPDSWRKVKSVVLEDMKGNR